MWRVLLVASSYAHTLQSFRGREAIDTQMGGSLALQQLSSALTIRALVNDKNITTADTGSLRGSVGTMFNGALQRMADARNKQYTGLVAHYNTKMKNTQFATASTTLLPSVVGLFFVYFATFGAFFALYVYKMLEESVRLVLAATLIYSTQSFLTRVQRGMKGSEHEMVYAHLSLAFFWLLVLEFALFYIRRMNTENKLKRLRLRTWGMFLGSITGFAFLLVAGDVQLRMHRKKHDWFVYCTPLFAYLVSAMVLMCEHALTGEGSRELETAEGVEVLRYVQLCENEVAAVGVSFTFAQAVRFLVTKDIQDAGGLEVTIIAYEFWEIITIASIGGAMLVVTFFAEGEHIDMAPTGLTRAIRVLRRSLHYIAGWCLFHASQMIILRLWKDYYESEAFGVPGRTIAASCCICVGFAIASITAALAGENRRHNATAIISTLGALIAFGWSHTYAWAFRDLGTRAGQEHEGDVGKNLCETKCLNWAAAMELVYAIALVIVTLPVWVRIIVPKTMECEAELDGEPKPPPPPPPPEPAPPEPAPPPPEPAPPPPEPPPPPQVEEPKRGKRVKHQLAHQ